MSTQYQLNAEIRTDSGTGAMRRLRREDKVPAIVYGGEKPPVALLLEHSVLLHQLENEGFYSQILTINCAGAAERVVLKDIQRNPGKPRILHMDLQRISETKKMHVHIPLHFIGEDIAPGVKLGGGIISHHLIEVEIACLPKDLPEFIEVDISALEMGQALHLSDLTIPEGVEIIALSRGPEHDISVVSIHAPQAVVEEEEAPVEAAAEEAPAAEEGGDKG